MSIMGLAAQAPTADSPIKRCTSIRDRALLTLVLYTLVRSGEALAGDNVLVDGAASKAGAGSHEATAFESTSALESTHAPGFASAPLHPPLSLSLAPQDRDGPAFSATEFRPRVHAPAVSEEPANAVMTGGNASFEGTVLQRLAEYKSQDRLRLLTLWQTRGSTVSLQANKHGGPSIQWSSPWMMHDSARGLFDGLLSVPLRGIANGTHNAAVRASLDPRASLEPRASVEPAKQLGLTSAPAAP